MQIRGCKSDIFGVKILPKVIFLCPNKTEIIIRLFLTSYTGCLKKIVRRLIKY